MGCRTTVPVARSRSNLRSRFREASEGDGIKQVLSAPRSPWQRAYVERVIGTIRRECLDHVIVSNERSLYRHLKSSPSIITGTGLIWRWRRTLQSPGRSSHRSRAGSYRRGCWVVCTIATSGAPPEYAATDRRLSDCRRSGQWCLRVIESTAVAKSGFSAHTTPWIGQARFREYPTEDHGTALTQSRIQLRWNFREAQSKGRYASAVPPPNRGHKCRRCRIFPSSAQRLAAADDKSRRSKCD